eukprot:TRINITY_DN65682_c0_g1_i4.p3 TRINITY_DN65682_c0_g1~~TRINITY_DN65682_c0_g1_i4.p3  ORF type:complete len:120 (-),score=28.22 TRINITY_DN65682_c0_g1_i4:95-454(-)
MCIRDRYQRRVHGTLIFNPFISLGLLIVLILFEKCRKPPFSSHARERRPVFSAKSSLIFFSTKALSRNFQAISRLKKKYGIEKIEILLYLSLIHISEPTRPLYISYAVFCLKKKKKIVG